MQTVNDSSADEAVAGAVADKGAVAVRAAVQRLDPHCTDFCVGPWLVSPSSNRLSFQGRADAPVRQLEPRIMQLLCELARCAGTVVEREELSQRLWPRVVVNDNSLTRAVSTLRKELELPPEIAADVPATLITTVPKKGYRLDAVVRPALVQPALTQRAGTEPVQPSLDSKPAPARLPIRWLRSPAVLSAAACLAMTAVFLLGQLVAQPDASVTELADRASAASLADPASTLWPDQQLTAGTASDPVSPATSLYSRDGELFAYVSYTDSGSALILGSRDGFNSPVNVYETGELIYNLQWSPVDNILLFAQKPRFSPASLFTGEPPAKLLMFDINTMAASIVWGAGAEEHADGRRKPFSVT